MAAVTGPPADRVRRHGLLRLGRQPGRRTVQDELERALCVVLRRDAVPLTVAGRTDAGVHAWGQVASHEGEPAPIQALNALLPDDVAVIASEAAAPTDSTPAATPPAAPTAIGC